MLREQAPPLRDYYTCDDCGKTGGVIEFRPPSVPGPGKRRVLASGLLPVLVMAEAAAEKLGGFERMMRMSKELLVVDRADRRRAR